MKTIVAKDKNGQVYDIPLNLVDKAIKNGLIVESQTVEMNKDGEVYDIPVEHYSIAEKSGYKMGAPISKTESFIRGAAQGASLGFSDEITGVVESALTDKTYDQARDESRQNNRSAEEQNPGSYTTGSVGGSIATALVPGLNVAKGLSVVGRVGMAAGLGGVDALGQSEAENLSLDQLKDVGSGATIGGIIGGAGEALGAGYRGAKNYLNPSNLASKAEERAVEAISPTLRQVKKMENREAVNAIGRDLLDNKIVTAGANKREMLERVNQKVDQYGSEIGNNFTSLEEGVNDSLAKAERKMSSTEPSLAADGLEEGMKVFENGLVQPSSIASRIRAKLEPYKDNLAYRKNVKQIEKEIETLASIDKPWTWKEAAAQKKAYGDVVNNWGLDQPVHKQFMQMVYKAIDEEMVEKGAQAIDSGLIEKTLVDGAGFKQNLISTKKSYSNMKTAQEALVDSTARESKNNDFGLTDYVLGGGISGGAFVAGGPVGAAAAGLATMAGRKVTREYGNQISAVGLDKLSKMIASPAGQALGKFRGVLENAYKRSGNKGLAATHFLLLQQNPEYRKIHQEKGNENE